MSAEPAAGEPAPTLDELISAWAEFHGATVAVSIRLAEGLDDASRLSLPAFEVLLRLLRAPGHRLPLDLVAADVGLTSGGFTKLLDRLELDGLVARERTAVDRRPDELTLTAHGQETASAALTQYDADLRRHLLGPLGLGGLGELAALSRLLRDHHRG